MASQKKTPRHSVFSEDEAPQVVYGKSPVSVSRDTDGLQLSPLAYVTPSPFNRESPGEPYTRELPQLPQRVRPRRKPKWPWILAVVLVICLGVGLGAGLGLGLHKKAHATSTPETTPPENDAASSSSSSIPSQPPSATSTSGLSTTPTSVPVTSGQYGIAAFGCNTTAPTNVYVTQTNPTSFTQQCYVDYPTYVEAYDKPDAQVQTLSALTTYRFEDCMDQCAIYNRDADKTECHAVSYSAHLDPNIHSFGGNCWLKNVRGKPFTGAPGEDYTLMASAYLTEDWD